MVSFIIKFADDQEILTDCIYIISYLADNHKKILKSIYEHNVLASIVKLLE